MTLAAVVLGIVGTVLAAWALTWNIVSFLLQGARPRLTPVVGVLAPDAGHLLSPATGIMSDTLRQTIEQFDGPLVVGVQVANAGRVLTRETLIDRIWGLDYVGDTKTLDVHVKRLRSKIEEDPSTPRRITTIRGLGYKFAGG